MTDGSETTVAVVLYGSLGGYQRAEIIYPNETSSWDDSKAEYAEIILTAKSEAMDVIERYEVEEITKIGGDYD